MCVCQVVAQPGCRGPPFYLPATGASSSGCACRAWTCGSLADLKRLVFCTLSASLPIHRRSIEFRLRLPGVDLWTTHKPLAAEVCLMFMLLGAGGHCCTSGPRKVGGAGRVLCTSRWLRKCASCSCCWGQVGVNICKSV